MQSALTYSRKSACKITGISEKRLCSFERAGLVEPREQLTFEDLVRLRHLKRFSENRVPPKQIRRSLTSLQKKLTGVEDPLRELRFEFARSRVSVDTPVGPMDALTGQFAFPFDEKVAADVMALTQSAEAELRRLREAEEWFQEGIRLEENEASDDEIREAYEQVIRLNPKAAGAWVNLGTIHFRQGLLPEAEECYRRALEVVPDYALAFYNLGNLHEERGRFPAAAEHYKLALKAKPDYADAHYNMALVRERLREPMEAAKHWRAYLQLDSESAWASVARRQLRALLPVTIGGQCRDTF